MGYDISLVCVREAEERPGFFCGIAEAPDFIYPARYVREMITVLDTNLFSQLNLRSEWLLDNSPPDGMLEDGEHEIEGYITNNHLYKPQMLLETVEILRGLSQEKTEPSQDFLFDLSRSHIEISHLSRITNEFWAIVDGEQKFFSAAWNRCESYDIQDSPIQWYSKDRPTDVEAVQDLSRDEELSVYLFGVAFSMNFGSIATLEEQKLEAYGRWLAGEPSDIIKIIKRSYHQKFNHLFDEIE